MDKKNTAIGAALIAAAVGLLFWNQKQQADYAKAHPKPVVAPAKPVSASAADPKLAADKAVAPVVAEAAPAAPEQLLRIENGTVRAVVTTHGAGVTNVSLLKHASELGKEPGTSPVLFNEFGKIPAFAVSFPDATGKPVAWTGAFAVKEQSPGRLVLEGRRDGLVVTREFSFPLPDEVGKKKDDKVDPHLIRVVTTFRRETGASDKPVLAALNLGALPPSESDPGHQFLNVSAYDGSAYEKVGADKFPASSGFLGFHAHPAIPDMRLSAGADGFTKPFVWFAASNQFFAGIATVDAKDRPLVSGLLARPVELPADKFPKNDKGEPQLTVTGDIELGLGALKPGETATVGVNWFVGPKEYSRLANLGEGQEQVVQFSKVFGFLSINWLCSFLMASLAGIHWVLDKIWSSNTWNWGWAIVILTVIVKGVTWPLTAMQLKSAEAMKKLQKPMEELKAKHKDNPQKMQQETMKLYREHRVNPFAGCLPVFIQIPIFAGLFYAFQTCAELRHHPFLWFPDLSVADTIPGLPHWVHILPVLMGLAMFANMRLTPMGNVDPNQKTIFYMMMFVFPVMCYTSPAGLTTYWTVNNFLTLWQTWRRKKKTEAAAAAAPEVEIIPPAKTKKKKA